MPLVIASFFVAVTEFVNDVTDTANKVGTLGMQGLLAFMLLILGFVIWYQEKKRTLERQSRDEQTKAQYDNLLNHHNDFIRIATEERAAFHAELKANNTELKNLSERSIVAMHAMATACESLKIVVQDRRSYLPHDPRSVEQLRPINP